MATVAREWTVTTWNIRGSEKPRIAGLAEAIAAEAPDVVLIQEIRRSQATALASRLGMRFSWAEKHAPYTKLAWWTIEGMAIMSPHALDAAGHTELRRGTLRHPWRRRIVQWALVGRPDHSTYRVYNLHLSPHERAPDRREEAVRVAEIVRGHGDVPPAIVGGDFNDDLDSSIIYALPGIEHIGVPPANPSDVPTRTLDHVLLPTDATDVSVTVPGGGDDWTALSDHLPVTVRFTLDWVEGEF